MGTPADIGTPLGMMRRVLQVLLGLLFVVSAVLKIVEIDPFEIYVYSYHFFSFDVSCLVARFAIILELVLGICLIFNVLHKLIWWGSVLMLLGYSGLMVYAMVLGRTDNCHCFGELLQFNPWQSLLKNLVLLLLFVPLYRVRGRAFRGQWPVWIGMVVACLLAVFLAAPPDFFVREVESGQVIRCSLFEEALHDEPLSEMGLDRGKKVVGVFSSSCNYCKLAARKLSVMQSHLGFPEQDVVYVFMGDGEGVPSFFTESESVAYPYVVFEDVTRLLRIIEGRFPSIVLLEEGKVVHAYGYGDLDERELKIFFQE